MFINIGKYSLISIADPFVDRIIFSVGNFLPFFKNKVIMLVIVGSNQDSIQLIFKYWFDIFMFFYNSFEFFSIFDLRNKIFLSIRVLLGQLPNTIQQIADLSAL